jgi:hypothetical protein
MDITNYPYKPTYAPKKEGWNELVNRFKRLHVHFQKLILKKLHGGTPKYGVYNIVC